MKRYLAIFLILVLGACDNDDKDFVVYPLNEEAKDLALNFGGDRPADSYNYPFYSNMEEWKEFETYEDMINACQIPKKRLRSMSTAALVQACIEYPLLPNLYLAPSYYQEYFDGIYSELYLFQELSGRKDASRWLAEKILSFKLIDESIPSAAMYYEAFKIVAAQNGYVKGYSMDNEKRMISKMLEELKTGDPFYGSTSHPSYMLMGRILHKYNMLDEYPQIIKALESGSFFSDDDMVIMNTALLQFIQ